MSVMSYGPFGLEENLITYDRELGASRIPYRWESLSDERIQCVFGVVAFENDESVHADQWERHPAGDEVLSVLEGRLLVDVDHGGTIESVAVRSGKAVIVPRGRWHRLQVLEPGRLLFFTPRAGTSLRPFHSRIVLSREARLS